MIDPNLTRWPLGCSFCVKPRGDCRALVAGGNTIAICDECVYLCLDIVGPKMGAGAVQDPPRALAPETAPAPAVCGQPGSPDDRVPGYGYLRAHYYRRSTDADPHWYSALDKNPSPMGMSRCVSCTAISLRNHGVAPCSVVLTYINVGFACEPWSSTVPPVEHEASLVGGAPEGGGADTARAASTPPSRGSRP